MSRKLRIEYPGAMYHPPTPGFGGTGVMNRGTCLRRTTARRGQREDIFRDDDDRRRLLSTLEGACAKTDWQVHAGSGTMSLKLNSAVELTAKDTKIAKKDSYEWIAKVFHSPGR